MRLLGGLLLPSCALLLAAAPALAQEESAGSSSDSVGGDEGIPNSVHPGSDSPESAGVRPGEPRSRRKAQAFLIPLDEQSRAATGRVAQALEGVLAGTAQYEVIDLGRALSVEPTPEQVAHAAEGRKLVAEGNAVYAKSAYADAADRYRAALKAMDRGLAAVSAQEYAELWLRLGAALHRAGEVRPAREAFLQVVRLDPQQKLQAPLVEPLAEQPLAAARADAETLATGVLEVESKPSGARVAVDGEAKGQAPLRLELLSGRHLVRIERAGFYPHVELLEVAARRPAMLAATLTATPSAASLNQIIAGAAEEASRGEAGPNVSKLAERFGLERLLIGSVSSHGTKLSVLVALVNGSRRRLVAKSVLLLTADGTDADQVEQDTQAATRKLIALDVSAGEAPVVRGAAAGAPGSPTAAGATAPGSAAAVPASFAPARAAALDPGERRAVMPGSFPAAAAPASEDDLGLASRERGPAAPLAPAASAEAAAAVPFAAAPAAAALGDEKAAPSSTDEAAKKKKDKKKKKGLQGKSGTEHWDDGEEN